MFSHDSLQNKKGEKLKKLKGIYIKYLNQVKTS